MKILNRELVAALDGYNALLSSFDSFCRHFNEVVKNFPQLETLCLANGKSPNDAKLQFLGKEFRIYFDIFDHEHRFIGVLKVEHARDEISKPIQIYKIFFDQQGTAFESFDGNGGWEELDDDRFIWSFLYRISLGYFEYVRRDLGFIYNP